MARAISIAMGLGLAVLWLVGLTTGATPWLTWLDGLVALASFAMAGMVGTRPGLTGAPALITAALFLMWLAAAAMGATPWLAWLTLAFACAFGVFAVAILSPPRRGRWA